MLGAALVLSQAVFGWERLIREPFPILPLMAGTNLPGDVLARFDVLWIALVAYGLFFSLGSVFSTEAISWRNRGFIRCASGFCSWCTPWPCIL